MYSQNNKQDLAGSNSLRDIPSPVRAPAIPELLTTQCAIIEVAHKQLNELSDRLRPIMRLEPEDPCKESNTSVSNIPDVIRNHNDQINRLCSRIQRVISQLEV